MRTDADAIAECGKRTFFQTNGSYIPTKDMDEYLAKAYTSTAIAQEMGEPNSMFLVAIDTSASETPRNVVGFLQLKLGTTEPCLPKDARLCEVNRVYVSSSHQGQGVGGILMEKALNWAREKLGGAADATAPAAGQEIQEQKPAVWVGVWENHDKQQRFYRRWGFEKVGQHGFQVGSRVYTDHVMLQWL